MITTKITQRPLDISGGKSSLFFNYIIVFCLKDDYLLFDEILHLSDILL